MSKICLEEIGLVKPGDCDLLLVSYNPAPPDET